IQGLGRVNVAYNEQARSQQAYKHLQFIQAEFPIAIRMPWTGMSKSKKNVSQILEEPKALASKPACNIEKIGWLIDIPQESANSLPKGFHARGFVEHAAHMCIRNFLVNSRSEYRNTSGFDRRKDHEGKLSQWHGGTI